LNINVEKEACTELGSTKRKRTISLKIRIRPSDMKAKENEHIVLARAKQMEQEKEEFKLFKERMQESGSTCSNGDFLGLLDRMRELLCWSFSRTTAECSEKEQSETLLD
jgi:hypothetical protein